MLVMKLDFSISARKIIFLIFENIKKLKNFIPNTHKKHLSKNIENFNIQEKGMK